MNRVFHRFAHAMFSDSFIARVMVYCFALTLLAALSASLVVAQQTASVPDIRALENASPIEREMRGGEAHAYQLTVLDGQYLRIVVEQNKLDVVLVIVTSDGRKIAQADTLNASHGLEIIAFIAQPNESYRLEIKPRTDKAPLGRYTIKIEERRLATQQDHIRIDAARLLMEAEEIYKARTVEASRRAAAKYQEATPLFESISDFRMLARTLKIIGFIREFTGDKQLALDAYTQVLPIVSYLEDQQEPMTTLYEIGRVHRSIYHYQQALDFYHQALTLSRAKGNQAKEVEALIAIGFTSGEMGENQKALNYYNEALWLSQTSKNRSAELQCLINLGGIHLSLEASQTALDYFNQALPIAEAQKTRLEPPVILNNLGRIYTDFGDYPKALEYLNQALTLRHALGDVIGEAATWTNIGRIHYLQGDTPKALEYFNTALSLYRQGTYFRGEAIVLTHLGRCYQQLGDTEKAADYYNQALKLRRIISDKNGEAIALYNLSTLEQGNSQDALKHISAAIQLVESVRTKVDVQELRASYLASFQSYYEHYIDLLMQASDGNSAQVAQAFQISERARARTLLDSLSESRMDIRQGVDANLLTRERELKVQLNAKSNNFLRLSGNQRTAMQAEPIKKELDIITAELQSLEGMIRQTSPRYAALTQPQPLSLEEIQQQVLDADSTLLEYSLGEKRSYVWVITQTNIRAYTLPKRAEIEAAARRFYDLLSARSQVKQFETVGEKQIRIRQADIELPQAAQALSQMILAPIAAQLKNQRLLIVSDGALQYIPFAALPEPVGSRQKAVGSKEKSSNGRRATDYGLPLMVEHEIVNLPSASTLAVLRREMQNRQPAPKTIAVLADPVFDINDERLTVAKANQKRESSVIAVARNRANRRGASPPANPAAANSQPNQSAAKVATPSATKSETPSAAKTSTASHKPPKTESELTRAAREAGLENDGSTLPRIPFTRLEAKAIARLVPPSQQKLAIDFEANKTIALSKELSQYRFVHFATHGFLNTSHPELSGIALSLFDEDGKELDGFLRAHEIYNLKLSAELVVLSACRTGLGKEIRGEGLIGMTRGFMYAGAARVLVSLWDVNDEATAEFMTRFYQAMLSKEPMTPAAALRVAQASMAKDKRWSSPYYWAAFVLQGEPK